MILIIKNFLFLIKKILNRYFKKQKIPCNIRLISQLSIKFRNFFPINTLKLGKHILPGICNIFLHHCLGNSFLGTWLFLGNQSTLNFRFESFILRILNNKRMIFNMTIHHKGCLSLPILLITKWPSSSPSTSSLTTHRISNRDKIGSVSSTFSLNDNCT